MRLPLLLLLAAAALSGCSTIREGLGEYQRIADKGIGVQVGDTPDRAAVAQEASKREALPGGLTGDKANAAYTAPR